jgi:hypothetical protein
MMRNLEGGKRGGKETTYLYANDQKSNEQSQRLGEQRYSHSTENACILVSISSLSALYTRANVTDPQCCRSRFDERHCGSDHLCG